ncbi:uncharacterized protein LOC120773572 [Bactrocera tryoni]|uniref:uncharacterized protein LOC120773572 n=1 Tax=Bactrocera tryoni TaxID=59916 RepID=UPI001A991B5E|nr:uncharacterized protein LOC120773572 [Bactrocera tryoni]
MKLKPFVEDFLESRNLPKRAILLLDNASSHPPEEDLVTPDGKIWTVFMPPNTNFNTDDLEAWNSVDNVLVEENPSAENELAIEISEEEEGDTAVVVAVPPVKHTDASDCFEKCIKWSEENIVEQEKIFLLKSLHQKAQDLKISRPQKQMSITNFFSVE